jgi:hypothetical protein
MAISGQSPDKKTPREAGFFSMNPTYHCQKKLW